MKSPGLDLSLIPAHARQRRTAYFSLGILAAIAASVLPFVHSRATSAGGFVPAACGAMCVIDIVIAALLVRQALLARRAALMVLACGYAASAVFVVAYVVMFPGVWDGAFTNAFSGAYAWLWIGSRVSVPVAAIVYAFAGGVPSDVRAVRRRVLVQTPFWSAAAAAVLLAVSRVFPLVTAGGVWRPAYVLILGPAIVVSALGAVVALARRGSRATLDLWLYVALAGTAFDVALTLASGGRFTAGAAAAHVETFVASAIFLGALVWQSGRLSSTVAESERRVRSLVDGIGDALITVDAGRRITSLNRAAYDLFGYGPADVGGLSIDDLIPNYADGAGAPAGMRAVEARGRHKNGGRFPLELVFGEGSETDDYRTIVIARDITQRKRAEAAIKAARDQAIASAEIKAQFLATMSHEIRTPINAVVGMSELLLQSELAPEPYDYAKTVRDSAESLLGVINEILDFSKIEAGKMEIDARPFSPLSVLENAADICAGPARAKGLSLVSYVAPDVPALVVGDASRVRQILINLIGNAVKFTSEGNVTARAVVDQIAGDRTAVRFSITDTGPGIAAADRAKLFQAFRQIDQSSRRRHGGTGLGLSISKRLTELMGGSIECESAPGAGSTFSFVIPFEKCDQETPVPETGRTVRGSRILIVDDDDVARAILEQYCMAWGAIGTSTATPAHVIALLRAAQTRRMPYDAVIVDYQMPGVDGFALAARIKSDPLIAATPLILLTGHDEAGRGADAIARGFIAYLRKPLKQGMLLDALQLALNGAPDRPASPPNAAIEPRDNVLVLIAEDNPVNRKLALQQLKKLGYRAHAVEDGREAVEAAERERYDVILMDCQMPEMDGFAATRSIRRGETATGRHIPIVAMTANALEGDREACLAAGMDEYLAKPVQLPELRAILERFTAGAVGAR